MTRRLEARETVHLTVGAQDVPLLLRRYGPAGRAGADAVLLLHGASSSGDCFLLPAGGLVRHLVEHGRDVWVLEWRGSPHVIARLPERWLGGSALTEIRQYTVDDVAREDIPAAVREVRSRIGPRARLSVLGHCVGGGALAIAVAQGRLEPFDVSRVVLSTLGLFYEVPWSGWIKAEDFILERVLHNNPDCVGISPRRCTAWPNRAWVRPWPVDFERAYGAWPGAWLPGGEPRGESMLDRLAFMVGQPYAHDRLDPSLSDPDLEPVFGALHMGLYLHVGQMVRRGFAAPFDAPDVIDRTRLGRARGGSPPAPSYLLPDGFRALEAVTLLCAADNQVWHRDAMDLMHEWLRGHGAPSVKRVFPGYNIMELLWGRRAAAEVYPSVAAAV